MDELWNYFTSKFDTHVIQHLPNHIHIINSLKHIIIDGGIHEIQNILLYGAKGFPVNLLWETIFKEIFIGKYYRNTVNWHNKLTYIETPYFFEIDMDDPNNPKELEVLSIFLKELVQHPCVHSRRHIIILHNIEKLCARRSSYSFRVLLERYSSNALFICTTHQLGSIESPLTSRCFNLRVPLPTNEEIGHIMKSLELSHHPLLIANDCRDIYFTLFVHWLTINMPEVVTEEFCNYNTIGIVDIIKNIETLTTNDDAFKILKDFERVIDDLDLYVYKNWEDGELILGPEVHRHTVTCSFMWPYDDMPDPVGAARLLDYGCKVTYQKQDLLVPRKVYKPSDFRPGTKKGKIDAHPIWVVSITMPKKLMQDIFQGQKRQQSEYVRDHIEINPNNAMTPDSAATEAMPNEPVAPAPVAGQ